MDEAFDRFTARVSADPSLQRHLASIVVPDAFEAAVRHAARSFGIDLSTGLAAQIDSPRALPLPTQADWPPPGWRPARIRETAAGAVVDWAHFAGELPRDSFYQVSALRCSARPFNRLFRRCTPLDRFVAEARAGEVPPPAGLIFHMSRCGSTLVSQMIAALPDMVAISEAQPLDWIVRLAVTRTDLALDWRVAALRAMVAALGGREPRRHVLKLDAWHILALPLFRLAFPEVPWVYLFRDPVEVLVSQLRGLGYQMVPALMPPGLYPFGDEDAHRPELQGARILALFHRAAIAGLDARGMAIDYAALPGAVGDRIAPFFGLAVGPADRAAMAAAAECDSKSAGARFVDDRAAKQAEASDALRAAAREHLAPLHAQLAELAAR